MRKPFLLTVGIIILFILAAVLIRADVRSHHQPTFKEYIAGVKKEAIKLGVSKKTANKYLDSLKKPKSNPPHASIHLPSVTKEETHQAQAELTFKDYKNQLIPERKIKKAQQEYQKHRSLLFQINQKYQVQPQVIIALWGIESNFGRDMGRYSLIRSLAILAYHHHRSQFYRRQLIDALIILDRKHIIPQMLLSAFDGGMGQSQFEPSAYIHYAVDYDHDGFKNIWTSLPDVFASIANFLHVNGWDGKQTWGIEVKLPNNFQRKYANLHFKKSIKFWQNLGVTQIDGSPLIDINAQAAIILPEHTLSPAYLVYPNFDVLMRWNYTTFESLTTGIFANKIVNVKI